MTQCLEAIRAVDRLMSARDQLDESSFLDVVYQDVIADPFSAISAIPAATSTVRSGCP